MATHNAGIFDENINSSRPIQNALSYAQTFVFARHIGLDKQGLFPVYPIGRCSRLQPDSASDYAY